MVEIAIWKIVLFAAIEIAGLTGVLWLVFWLVDRYYNRR